MFLKGIYLVTGKFLSSKVYSLFCIPTPWYVYVCIYYPPKYVILQFWEFYFNDSIQKKSIAISTNLPLKHTLSIHLVEELEAQLAATQRQLKVMQTRGTWNQVFVGRNAAIGNNRLSGCSLSFEGFLRFFSKNFFRSWRLVKDCHVFSILVFIEETSASFLGHKMTHEYLKETCRQRTWWGFRGNW